MSSFYLYFGIACVGVFFLIGLVSYVVEKEKREPAFAEKMDLIRVRWKQFDPVTKFFTNLFWWAMAALFIYFIAF